MMGSGSCRASVLACTLLPANTCILVYTHIVNVALCLVTCVSLIITVVFCSQDGNLFQDAVFNETINLIEPDEGLDGET